ncbi:MAG: hypothetical protein J0M19_02100 [Sphingomonadales bacterium]|nr:hypothetical protein [Sphingomonadales bacterium]
MQDRYAADIGDYVKLAILRRLGIGRELGVLWWLYPDEAHNADGKHISYLAKPESWRSRDPHLFDALKLIVEEKRRNVAALEAAQLFPQAKFFSEIIPTLGSKGERHAARAAWFARALDAVSACDLVFLDPDNGLETKNFDPGASKAGKSVALDEICALRRSGRTIVVYHHQTRMKGGHIAELSHWGKKIADLGFTVDALRASAFSARAFFILDASQGMRLNAEILADEWGSKLTWHQGVG